MLRRADVFSEQLSPDILFDIKVMDAAIKIEDLRIYKSESYKQNK